MHKFQLTFNPSFCVLWPKIKIFHNKNLILVFDTQDKICEFTISQQSKNFLELEYFNKTEKHTKIKSDVIVQDQFLELVKIRVDDILKHVLPPNPPNFYWDTFKVDIQGSYVEAIISSGDLIKNFVCVVGEFDYNAYDLPKDIMTDPKMILTGYNFKKVYGGVNEIWMNSLYIEAYRSIITYNRIKLLRN
jgi:hypothetical protein